MGTPIEGDDLSPEEIQRQLDAAGMSVADKELRALLDAEGEDE